MVRAAWTDGQWVSALITAGQDHLFGRGESEAERKRLIDQIRKIDASYPGGIFEYCDRARKRLKDSMNDVNPFEGCTPKVPFGKKLTVGTEEFRNAELTGASQLAATCFVLVAGGLGERLGYPGIKISLPSESCTEISFIELYVKYILAYQDGASKELNRTVKLPFVIMTSDDTQSATVELLSANSNFGLDPDQITILKQEKVPALYDSDARLALSPNDPFLLDTKPHGHGDVHTLLMQAGLPEKWVEMGYKWLVFFQDTNALSFRCIPAAIGTSAANNLTMNSVVVPRCPGDAIGSIVRLEKRDGTSLTTNVEYNQLEPLLKVVGDTDSPNHEGRSVFPGNINLLVMHIPRYSEVLQMSHLNVPEFVNPKYTDATKQKFKTPTRMECMMQDFPRMLFGKDLVGFTEFDRWLCFSAVKNSRTEAAQKIEAGIHPECALSGEADAYAASANLIRQGAIQAGCHPVDIPEPQEREFGGVKYRIGPRVVLLPSFAVTFEQLKNRFVNARGKPFVLSPQSTIVLEGDVEISGLTVNGSLVARALPGVTLDIHDLTVSNAGWELVSLPQRGEETQSDIKGFRLVRHEQMWLQGSPTF